MNMPKWFDQLFASVCDACVSDVKGRMSGFACRWAKPEQNQWGIWLLQIAPSAIEISGGRDDGETVFDFVDVDLLALPRCLDEVETFANDPDYGKESRLTLMGKKGKREVVVEIYFEPFEDDEAATVFDANFGRHAKVKEVEREIRVQRAQGHRSLAFDLDQRACQSMEDRKALGDRFG